MSDEEKDESDLSLLRSIATTAASFHRRHPLQHNSDGISLFRSVQLYKTRNATLSSKMAVHGAVECAPPKGWEPAAAAQRSSRVEIQFPHVERPVVRCSAYLADRGRRRGGLLSLGRRL